MRLILPGDKSISHRSLMLAALGRGTSRVRGVLRSADIESTAAALRALGVNMPSLSNDELVIEGVGLRGLRAPQGDLDCGNSGTTTRLMAGVVAGAGITARFVGDASLSARPMRRVAAPLESLGARVDLPPHGGLPMTVHGAALRGGTWTPEAASAQIKSAILLAGLVGNVPVEINEPAPTRDHTERMLRARGVDVRTDGLVVTLVPNARLDAADVDVPGDPSSAAFFAGFAAMGGVAELAIANVCVNPGRVGAFRALLRMGAALKYEDTADQGGEPVATVVIRGGLADDKTARGDGMTGPGLRGIAIDPDDVPSLIDELPLLACVAARATGETRVTGAHELRVKESDRIHAIVSNLRAVGADAEELPDGFVVRGSDQPLRGRVVTHGDHRIAMAFGVLGALPGNAIEIDDPSCAGVSYPSFWDDLARVGGARAK